MPTKKRKRGQAHSQPTRPNGSRLGFLLLPLDIKLKIYEYCYLFKTCEERYSCKCKGHKVPKSSRAVAISPRNRAFFEKSRCSYPFLHQSLLLTCRQTYRDVWPLYTACHSLSFSHPIRFANEILSFKPESQLQHVRHLALRVTDMSFIYNTASKFSMRCMISDVKRLFEHYPDVFYNLLSFTWETQDVRSFYPNQTENEDMMFDLILAKLVENHEYERAQAGLADAKFDEEILQSSVRHQTIKKWRTGCLARVRNLMVNKIQKHHETGSIIFYERLEPGADSKEGLQYLKLSRWLKEPLTLPASSIGQQVENRVRPVSHTWYRDFSRFTKSFSWAWKDLGYLPFSSEFARFVVIDIGT